MGASFSILRGVIFVCIIYLCISGQAICPFSLIAKTGTVYILCHQWLITIDQLSQRSCSVILYSVLPKEFKTIAYLPVFANRLWSR